TPAPASSATVTPAPSTITPGKTGEVGKAPSGIPKASAPKTAPQPQPVPAIPPPTAPVQAATTPSKAPPAKAPTVVAQAPGVAGARRRHGALQERRSFLALRVRATHACALLRRLLGQGSPMPERPVGRSRAVTVSASRGTGRTNSPR